MHTAHLILKDHPDRENMKYLVHPFVREHIFGISELTSDWTQHYKEEYQYLFPNLNVDYMKTQDGEIDDLFYLRGIQPELSDRFLGKTVHEIEELLKESIIERFPRSGVKPIGTRYGSFLLWNTLDL